MVFTHLEMYFKNSQTLLMREYCIQSMKEVALDPFSFMSYYHLVF